MVAPFFSQPGSAFKPVLIWARVILGIATEYGAQTAGSRRKPLRQRETDINPVQNDEADEKGFERRSNHPKPASVQPALIEQAVRGPKKEPERNANAGEEGQRIPAQGVGEIETGTGLETARAAAEGTRHAGQFSKAAEGQREVPFDGQAGDGEQAEQPGKSPGPRQAGAGPF